jgi:flagellar biosynthesis GTPase FlhF
VSLLCFLQDDERLERAIEFAQRKGVLPVSATRKDALVKFYEKHDTAKIPDIDKMLTQHKYEDILKAMMKKYGEVPEDPQSATRKVALIRFYEKHDPSKIKDVDVLLRKHKYEAVVKSLKAKYGDVPGAETVEKVHQVHVQGRSVRAQAVALSIQQKMGEIEAEDKDPVGKKAGRVIVLQGLSGTGKGTTIRKLAAVMPNVVAWSNSDVFRALTVLALRYCEQKGISFSSDALTPAVLKDLVAMMEVRG